MGAKKVKGYLRRRFGETKPSIIINTLFLLGCVGFLYFLFKLATCCFALGPAEEIVIFSVLLITLIVLMELFNYILNKIC